MCQVQISKEQVHSNPPQAKDCFMAVIIDPVALKATIPVEN
jgi:hypothetical protein